MNKKQEKKITGGLKPLPPDNDYSHSKVFGSLKKIDLPTGDFLVSTPLFIKDQGNTDFCTAYAACAVSEDQEGVVLNPEYVFMKSKELSGDPQSWGQDLRMICKAMCSFGALEQQYFPYLNRPQERDFYVDSNNWDKELDGLAYEHRKNSFFTVDGPYDTYDNFLMTLEQNKEDSRSILTGLLWRDSYTRAENGIIPDAISDDVGEPHAFKIFGQKIIDGKPHLVAQLSNSNGIGDNGLFYFPRGVVNREFVYGAFTFSDMPKEMAQYHAENGISINDGLFKKFLKVIRTIIRNYFGV